MEYIASDIEPTSETVSKADYNNVERSECKGELCVGFNPPFGVRGNGAKKYISWATENIKPDKMLLILPFIGGGWLPDKYRVLGFMDERNIFKHGISGKSVVVNVRIFCFVRDETYTHIYDLKDRYHWKTLDAAPHAVVEMIHHESKNAQEAVERLHYPVMWVKRTGERSGKVFLIDNDGKDDNWDYLEPEKDWKQVSLAQVDKTMSMTNSWVQVSGMDKKWLLKLGRFFGKRVKESDIFQSGSSLSCKQKNGGIAKDCVKHYVSRFLKKHPKALKLKKKLGPVYKIRK